MSATNLYDFLKPLYTAVELRNRICVYGLTVRSKPEVVGGAAVDDCIIAFAPAISELTKNHPINRINHLLTKSCKALVLHHETQQTREHRLAKG